MFTKGAITVKEQIERLKERGLIINHPKIAEKYLYNISYYRLGSDSKNDLEEN